MILYIVRHGDPIYNPDSLTPKGLRQAEAVGKRLAVFGLDEIYASPLKRAQQTAAPAAEMLKKEIITKDFMSENLAFNDFRIKHSQMDWCWVWVGLFEKMRSKEVVELDRRWYEADVFRDTDCKRGCERILRESDAFLENLGYRHDYENRRYIPANDNDRRIAAFCHEGFGMSWLATILDLPLPTVWQIFSISHSCYSVIKFSVHTDGFVYPQLLSFSNDSHLYKEGLPLDHKNEVRI